MWRDNQEVLYLQPMIPPKRFDIFSPLIKGWSEGLDAFRLGSIYIELYIRNMFPNFNLKFGRC